MDHREALKVFTTDDPMPFDYPFHLSRIKIGKEQEGLRERVYRIHAHEYLQILMVMGGKILHESGSKRRRLREGELVCIPAFQKHRDQYDIGSEIVTISFMPSIVDSLFANPHLLGRSGHFSESFLASFFIPVHEDLRCFEPRGEAFVKLSALVQHMDLEQKDSSPRGRVRLHSRVMEFLSALQGLVDLGDWSPRAPQDGLESSLSHLQQHYFQDVSIENLIQSSGLSATQFRKAFKGLTGRSCLQYLNELRIFHAITAIRNTDRPLKDIASDVGFKEFATFHRVFKRIKGVGPKTFRDGLK